MFVLSKWQRVALRTRWRASVRALFYCYHTFLDHTTNINRKLHCTEARQCVGSAKQCSKVSLGRNKHGQYNTTPKCPFIYLAKGERDEHVWGRTLHLHWSRKVRINQQLQARNQSGSCYNKQLASYRQLGSSVRKLGTYTTTQLGSYAVMQLGTYSTGTCDPADSNQAGD